MIQISESCCDWESVDRYRFLLARLQELRWQHGMAVTMVLATVHRPDWFSDALEELGVEVEVSD